MEGTTLHYSKGWAWERCKAKESRLYLIFSLLQARLNMASEVSMVSTKNLSQEKSRTECQSAPTIAHDGGKDAPDGANKTTKTKVGKRYLLKETGQFEVGFEAWNEAPPAARSEMERRALIANVIRKNMKKVAEDHGIPFEAFEAVSRNARV